MIPTSRLLFALPLLALAGCMSSQRSSYHVDIANVAIAGAEMGLSEAQFTLRVANQEMFPIVVERDTHRISIDGVYVGEASSSETYALPQLGVATRVVKLRPSGGPGMDAIRAAIQRGGGEFKIDTRFHTNSGGDKSKLDIKSSGTFSISAD